MKDLTLVILLFLTVTISLAQSRREEKDPTDDLFYEEKFEEALAIYNEVLAKDPKNTKYHYHAEICSLLTHFPQKPLDDMLLYAKEMSRKDKFYNYWLGRVLFGQYEFEKAIEAWKKFLEVKKYKSREIINETQGYIKNTRRVIKFYSKPEAHHAQRLPDVINTEFSEITPTYVDNLNELLYASSSKISSDPNARHPFHVFSSFFDGTNWSKPEVQSSLGSYDEDNVNLEVIGNDGRLLMYKANRYGALQESEMEHDSIWSRPHLFDLHIKNARLKPHFYVNEQENVLIFSTRKKGKDGDLDLQYTVKVGDTWTKPRPFGNTINTDSNEESAFLASDGKTLYFSSDGHNSIGGYDIFKSVYDSIADQWSTPENLGYPINTIENELYFKLKPNGKEGFFSSDRYHADGSYDIYQFWETSYNLITGRVIDISGSMVANAYVRFHPTKYLDTDFKAISNSDGTYETHIITGDDYDVEVFLDHEMIFQKTYTIDEEHDPDVVIKRDLLVSESNLILTAARDSSFLSSDETAIALKDHLESEEFHNELPIPKEVSPLDDLGSKFRKGQKAMMHNVYFSFGSAKLTEADKEALQELVDLMTKYPDLKVEIGGHTDNVGPDAVNMTLSEDRADNVAKYLLTQGISLLRLQPIGYGESRPMASNDDEQNGRELNRRIEVVVIE